MAQFEITLSMMFQFQNGSINSHKDSNQYHPPKSFNSKMVRLIEAGYEWDAEKKECFNSKMVRLIAR